MKQLTTLIATCLMLFSQSVDAKSPKYKLAATAIFRDEARWIKEWIEYHKIVGVQHFYLYNNLSKDNYKEVLAPYIKRGEVELFEWPHESTSVPHWTHIQTGAYRDAIKRARDTSEWLAIIDLDEFIVPLYHDNLQDFLANYKKYGGVSIHWQLFGTSHVASIPTNQLMVETLVMKAEDTYGENAFVKTILQPKYVRIMTDPHTAHYVDNRHQVTTHKVHAPNSINHDWDLDWVRINHYWSRDEEWFNTKKRARREGWNEGFDGQLQRLQQLNSVPDYAISRFIPELRRRMGLPAQQ